MSKKDFTLSDLYNVFRKRWIIILISAVVLAGLMALYSTETYVAKFTSTSTFYVTPDTGDGYTSENKAALDYSIKIIDSYTQLVTTNDFVQRVEESYQKDFPDEYVEFEVSSTFIKNAISTKTIKDTSIFKVQIMTTDINVSYHIAQTVAKVLPGYIDSVSGVVGTVHVADNPRPATMPSTSTNLTRNVLLGFIIGALVSYLICFFVDLFDVRIRSEEDILDTYTVPLIGTIPNFDQEQKRR